MISLFFLPNPGRVIAFWPSPPAPLPTTGRGETESVPLSAPPRPAFGRGGRGVRACRPENQTALRIPRNTKTGPGPAASPGPAFHRRGPNARGHGLHPVPPAGRTHLQGADRIPLQ